MTSDVKKMEKAFGKYAKSDKKRKNKYTQKRKKR